ncbi:MAG: TonB family protein [Fibromonadaceae bacterium]|jgi:TonB family protein|nr:TonB family protein [Fibromonadaceae bacterium]
MNIEFYEEKNDFFSIMKVSFLFHFAIVAALLLAVWLRPEKEKPPPIPFFEMVNVAPPPPAPKQEAKQPEPVPEPIAEPIPEPVPEIQPELKPEIKLEEPKPEPKPVPKTEPKPEPKPVTRTESTPSTAPPMDMPMDLPTDIKKTDMDMPVLRTLGSVIMDPQLEAYLKTLHRLIYQNFNPPSGTEITRGTKSSVQFKIARNGDVSEVVLRSSSGNSIWDRLAVRAVQIAKPPPLPPNFASEDLPLIFDFREK